MAKISICSSQSIESAIEDFIFCKTAQGVTKATINCYKSHLQCMSKYLDYTARVG